MIDDAFSLILDVLLLPLQLILVPVDAMLAKIEGVGAIPSAIRSFASLMGSLPETMVAITGINPMLWNVIISSFLLYMVTAPGINILKTLWGWIRP